MASGFSIMLKLNRSTPRSGFTAAYTGPLAAIPRSETTIFSRPAIPLNISRVETLRGARSAMVAVGLEAAVALCLFGVWGIWHLLR